MRRALTIAILVAATPAHASVLQTTGCNEQEAVVEGDAAAVAARLPVGFTAVTAPDGAPLIVAHTFRCNAVSVDGGPATPARFANVGILIESPDGVGCASGAPVVGAVKGDVPPACNWYALRWLSARRSVARWFGGARKAMSFSLGAFDPAQGGEPFRFSARREFSIDDVGRPRPGEISVRGAYWEPGLRIGIASDDITAGDATGTLRAPAGSLVATLMGATERSFAPGYDAVASVSWRHLTYTKSTV